MHCRSAEREVDEALNVLRRGNICMLYCSHRFIHLSLSLSLSLSLFSLTTSGCAKPHVIYAPSTSGRFSQITYNMRPYYRGVVFLVLFWKSTKNFGLAFLSVSCRLGCLKRPLRASNLFGVSAAIPTAPPFTPQNPTAR